MFVVCSIIGYYYMGIYGIVVGVIATLVEGTYGIDDNITVPLATALLVFIPSINL